MSNEPRDESETAPTDDHVGKDGLPSSTPDAHTGSEVYGLLADLTRRRLLTALRGQERSVGDLVIELAVSQPTVSKHLRTLREGGLVRMRASGQRRLYSLRLEPLLEASRWLDGFAPATATTRGDQEPVSDGVRHPAEAASTGRGTARTVREPVTGPDVTEEDGAFPIGRTVG